jgi:hypothetical protein
LVAGPSPSLGAPSVPIVIDGSESEHNSSDSDLPGTTATFPAAAASRDEIEQLRLQAAAAARSYREACDAAARREAIYQAAVAPPADAHGDFTADGVRADLRLILKSVLDIQKAIERMAARGI